MDQMLDDISIYWFTNTAASSARIYWENRGASFSGGKVTLPVAASVFPRDFFPLPRTWAEQTSTNLIDWHELERGGHFAASEEPDLFVQELPAALSSLRQDSVLRPRCRLSLE